MHQVPGFNKTGIRMQRILRMMPKPTTKDKLTLGEVMEAFPTVENFTRSYSAMGVNDTELLHVSKLYGDALLTAQGKATPEKQVRKKMTSSQRKKLKRQMEQEQQAKQAQVKTAKKQAQKEVQKQETEVRFARAERSVGLAQDLFGANSVNTRRGSTLPPQLYGNAPDLENHALTTGIINSRLPEDEQKTMDTDQLGLTSGTQRAYSKQLDGEYAPTEDHDKPLTGHKGSVAPGVKHTGPAASRAAPGTGANLALVESQGLDKATHNASDENAEQRRNQDVAFAAQGQPNNSNVAGGDEDKVNGGSALTGATMKSVEGKSSNGMFDNNPSRLARISDQYGPSGVQQVLQSNRQINNQIDTGLPSSRNAAEMKTPPRVSQRQLLVQRITPKARALQQAVNSGQKKRARTIANEMLDELPQEAKIDILASPQVLEESNRRGMDLEVIAARALGVGLLAAAPAAAAKGGRPFMSGALSAAGQAVWDIWEKYAGPSSPDDAGADNDVEMGVPAEQKAEQKEPGVGSRMAQAAVVGLAGGAGVVGAATAAAGVAVGAEAIRRAVNGMYARLWPEGVDVPDQAQAPAVVDDLVGQGANRQQAEDIQARMANDRQRNNVEQIVRELLKDRKPEAAEPSEGDQQQQQPTSGTTGQNVRERPVVAQSRGMPVFTPGSSGGGGMGSSSAGQEGVAAGRDHEACSSRSKFLEGELRPFLPIAGGEVVQLDPGEVLRKKVSLALWESMRGRNPNGTLYTNRLLRQNQYNWDLRMRDPMYITPVIEGPGYGVNQGVMPWGQRDPRPFQTPAWRRKLQDGLKRASIRHQTGNPQTAEKLLMMEKESVAKRQIKRLMATDQSFTNNPVSKGVHHPQEGFQASNNLNTTLVNVEPPLNTAPTLAVLPTPFERPRMSRVSAYGFPRRGPISRTSALWKPPVTWRNTAVNPQIEPPDNFQEDINTTNRWDSNEAGKVLAGVKREPVMQILDSRVRKRPRTVRRRDL
jgi:hypothetical protein